MRHVLIAVSLLLAATDALCQSSKNPCWKTARAQSEMNRCADLDFQEADAKLNKIYANELRYMKDDLADAHQRDDEEWAKVENAAIANLKDAEGAWLSYRDVQCKAAADYDRGNITDDLFPMSDDPHRAPHCRPKKHL